MWALRPLIVDPTGVPKVQLGRLCTRCGEPKSVNAFRRGRICRKCDEAYQQARRAARYAKCTEIQRRKKLERHSAIDRLKAAPCADCAKSFPPYMVDFDHRDRTTKHYEISQLINKSSAPWPRVLEEIAKCDVVCVCCHRLRTWAPGTKWMDNRRRLIIKLKNRPCTDCGGPSISARWTSTTCAALGLALSRICGVGKRF